MKGPLSILSFLSSLASAFKVWAIRRGGECEGEKSAIERELQYCREEVAMLEKQLMVARAQCPPPGPDRVLNAIRSGGM